MKRLLLGMVAACMATSMVAQDPATYEKAGEYTLENLWMKAATTGNNMGVADQLGGASDSRGMTVKGDEMSYFYGYQNLRFENRRKETRCSIRHRKV